MDNLAVIHINDSLNERGTRKDRHANIGLGKIGFLLLLRFIEDESFTNIVKILGTPYKYEIMMLRQKVFNEQLLEMIKENE